MKIKKHPLLDPFKLSEELYKVPLAEGLKEHAEYLVSEKGKLLQVIASYDFKIGAPTDELGESIGIVQETIHSTFLVDFTGSFVVYPEEMNCDTIILTFEHGKLINVFQ